MIQGNRGDRQAGCHRRAALPPAPGRLLVRARRPARVVLHDLRAGSPTDGHDHAFDLGQPEPTAPLARGVFIPPGVAHGFAALTDMTITYLVDGYYNPTDELGVAWDDPACGRLGPDRSEPVRPRRSEPAARRDPAGSRTPACGLADAHMNAVRHRRSRVHRLELRALVGCANTDDEVIVYDALTYAGNLSTLRDVDDTRATGSCRATSATSTSRMKAMRGHESTRRPLRGREPRRPLDRRTRRLRPHQLLRHQRGDGHRRRVGVESSTGSITSRTDEVYGISARGRSRPPSRSPYAPRSPYSASKAGGDLSPCRTYSRPTGSRSSITPHQQLRALPVPGEGHPAVHHQPARRLTDPALRRRQNRRDWIYVDDHCAAIDLVLDNGRVGEIYNIGAGNETPNRVLVDKLLAAARPAARRWRRS